MNQTYNTPQMATAAYQAALSAFESGTIADSSRAELQTYLLAISLNVTGDDAVQARDIAQVLTLNHLVLQRHIDELERRNKFTQYLVVALTVASLAGTVAQAWLAYKADLRSDADTKKQLLTGLSDRPQMAPSTAPTKAPTTTSGSSQTTDFATHPTTKTK